jgi:hypothetical protein
MCSDRGAGRAERCGRAFTEARQLYVAWQNPNGRATVPVGLALLESLTGETAVLRVGADTAVTLACTPIREREGLPPQCIGRAWRGLRASVVRQRP